MPNNKIYNQEYYKKNIEKRKLLAKSWRKNNPEKDKETRDKWLKKNPNYHKDKMKTYRPRANEVARNWRKRNPDGAKDAYYRYQYGISLEEYNKMFVSQNGVCAICEKSESANKRSLCVDHNHSTGLVRGLLCLDCNSGIGHLKDSKAYLLKAIEYLDRNREANNSTR